MHYSVTGGCGFIGSNFIRKVLRDQVGVRVTSADALTHAGNLWVPKQAFNEVIAAMVEWYRGNEAWCRPLMKP